jgi:hypothetical protein
MIEKKVYNNDYMINNKIILKEKRQVYENTEERKKHNNERQKQYNIDNKDHICELARLKKNTCDCGSVYRSRDRSQHLKSKKHVEFLKILQ